MSAKNSLVILHLTDFHIRDENSNAPLRLRNIAGHVGALSDGESDLLIIISGDVGYSGKSSEYGIMKNCLRKLEEELANWPFKKLTICAVPGNHDCDFDLYDASVRDALINGVRADDKSDASGIVRELVKVQAPFRSFESEACAELNFISDVVASTRIEFNGTNIQILLVNGAWSSRLHEQPGQLRMVPSILPEINEVAELSISVAHHPLNWYAPEDGRTFSEWLDGHVDIAFWGHEHHLDHFEISRKRYGSTVRHVIGQALDDANAICGFRCLKIDGNFETIYDYLFEWSGSKFKKVKEAKDKFCKNPARSVGQIRFSSEFREFMLDIGGSFKHPRLARPLVLDDVYVPPDFKGGVDANNDLDLAKKSKSVESVFEGIFSREKTFIFGSEQSGKTTFAKRLIDECRQRGVTPFYLDLRVLPSFNRGEITSWVNRSIERQFAADCTDDVKCVPPSNKVLIVDAVADVSWSNGEIDLVVDQIGHMGARCVFLTSQPPAMAMLAAKVVEQTDSKKLLRSDNWYELLPMGHKRRGQLIRKWASIGREPLTEGESIEAEVRQIKTLLDRAFGRNFMPRFPFFLLIVLQQIETVRNSATLVTNGSHGHLFEALIVQALSRFVHVHDISLTHDFLARLALSLWRRSDTSISEGEIEVVARDFLETKLVALRLPDLLRELNEAKVLRISPEGISFRYDYLYYFYLARWVGANIESDEAVTIIEQLITKIHTEQSVNVIMFIAYQGHEEKVLDYVLPMARQFLADEKVACLEDRSSLAGKFGDSKSRQILLLGDPQRVSDHHNEQADEVAEIEADRERQDDALGFITATRLVDVLGYIVKSRAGGLSAERKLEVVGESIALTRRLMNKLYDIVEESADDLAKMASEAFEKKLRLDSVSAAKVARKFVAMLVASVAQAMVGRAADSFASPELVPLIDRLDRAAGEDRDLLLFALVARLAAQRDFPREVVDDFLKGMKSANVLAHSVVAWAVNRRFYLMPPAPQIRESMCKRLGIEMKHLPSQ